MKKERQCLFSMEQARSHQIDFLTSATCLVERVENKASLMYVVKILLRFAYLLNQSQYRWRVNAPGRPHEKAFNSARLCKPWPQGLFPSDLLQHTEIKCWQNLVRFILQRNPLIYPCKRNIQVYTNNGIIYFSKHKEPLCKCKVTVVFAILASLCQMSSPGEQ